MNNKYIVILFFVIFLAGCTSFYGANLDTSGFGRRGVQMEFNLGFPNKGNVHEVRFGDSVQVAFNLRNYGDSSASGTVKISEKQHGMFRDEIIQFDLEGLRETERTTQGADIQTRTLMPIVYAPYQYDKQIFDASSFGLVEIGMDYYYETKLSGEICVASLLAASGNRLNTCKATETISERQLREGGIHPVSVEKIEKRTEQFQDSYKVMLDIYLKDYGSGSSYIVGDISNFNLELQSGISVAECERPPFKFDNKKTSKIRCSFRIASQEDITRIPFKISFNYPYKVVKVVEIDFAKEQN